MITPMMKELTGPMPTSRHNPIEEQMIKITTAPMILTVCSEVRYQDFTLFERSKIVYNAHSERPLKTGVVIYMPYLRRNLSLSLETVVFRGCHIEESSFGAGKNIIPSRI